MLKVFSLCVILLGLPGLQGCEYTPVRVEFAFHHVDVNSWPAVEANLQQRNIRPDEVTHLKFYQCDLTQIPDWVGEKMPNLRELDIRHNKVKKIPETIGHLTKLTNIDADNNAITEIPSFLSNLPKLQFADFASNRLKNISKSSLNLPHLSFLNLADNQIGTLPDLSGLKNLQGLRLEHNKDIRFGPQSKPLDSLNFLDLSHCNLKTVPSVVGTFSKLRNFNLAGNPLLEEGSGDKWGKKELKQRFGDKVRFREDA
ncbi:MAG: leucine-rich repeat domain-containing protein [Holosporaceae bacterium]